MDHHHSTHTTIRAQLLFGVRTAVHEYLNTRIQGGKTQAQMWTGTDDAMVQSSLLEIFLHELHAKTLHGKVADLMKSAQRKRAEAYTLLWRYFNSLGVFDTISKVSAQVPEYDTMGRCRDFIRECILNPTLLKRAMKNEQIASFYTKTAFLMDSDSVDTALSFLQGIWAAHEQSGKAEEHPNLVSSTEESNPSWTRVDVKEGEQQQHQGAVSASSASPSVPAHAPPASSTAASVSPASPSPVVSPVTPHEAETTHATVSSKKKSSSEKEKKKEDTPPPPPAGDSDEVIVSRKKVNKNKHHHSSKKASPTPSRKSSRSTRSLETQEEVHSPENSSSHITSAPADASAHGDEAEERTVEEGEVQEPQHATHEEGANIVSETPQDVEEKESSITPPAPSVDPPAVAPHAEAETHASASELPPSLELPTLQITNSSSPSLFLEDKAASPLPDTVQQQTSGKDTAGEEVAQPTPVALSTSQPAPPPALAASPSPVESKPPQREVLVTHIHVSASTSSLPSATASHALSPSSSHSGLSPAPSSSSVLVTSHSSASLHVSPENTGKEKKEKDHSSSSKNLLSPPLTASLSLGEGNLSEHTSGGEEVSGDDPHSTAPRKHKRKSKGKIAEKKASEEQSLREEVASDSLPAPPVSEGASVASSAPTEMSEEERLAQEASAFAQRFAQRQKHAHSESALPVSNSEGDPQSSTGSVSASAGAALTHSLSSTSLSSLASNASIPREADLTESKLGESVRDVILQHQRRELLSSATRTAVDGRTQANTEAYGQSHLLPTDPHAWTDSTGRVKRVPSEYVCPQGWQWADPAWQVDVHECTHGGDVNVCKQAEGANICTDADGWQYAIDFGASWKPEPSTFCFVRRRRWVRTRVHTGRVDASGLVKDDAKVQKLNTVKSKVGRSFGPDHYIPGDATRMVFSFLTDSVKSFVKSTSSLVKQGAHAVVEGVSVVHDKKKEEDPEEAMIFKTASSEFGDDFVDVEVDQNTSLQLLSKITTIPPESTMEDQGNLCPQCGLPIPIIDPDNKYEFARKCYFDGHWYCHSCHSGKSTYIPARILASGNFTKMPVHDVAYRVLVLHEQEPIYKPGMFSKPGPYNPEFAAFITHIHDLCALRSSLASLTTVVNECSQVDKTTFRKMMWPREYLLEDNQLFSVDDMHEAFMEITTDKPNLTDKLVSVVNFCKDHIRHCSKCTSFAKKNNVEFD